MNRTFIMAMGGYYFFDYYYPNICLQRYVDVCYALVFCLKLYSTQLNSTQVLLPLYM